MALSLDDVNKKKKAKKKKPAQTKKRTTRPWEEKVETPAPSAAGLLVRAALKKAFACKDALVENPIVKMGWSTATQTVQTAVKRNAVFSETLTKIDSTFKVGDKVSQALTLAKLIENEIRQKL